MSISSCPEDSVKYLKSSDSSPAPIWYADTGSGPAVFTPSELTIAEAAALRPSRKVGSSEMSRNITVEVWSALSRVSRNLESGLEHDLHRRLDRPRQSLHVIPQPFRVTLPTAGDHIPDLLQIATDGTFRVWDVKPESEIDDAVRLQTAETASACQAVGWEYEMFTGMEPVERINLMFLNGYRRTSTSSGIDLRPWVACHEATVLNAAADETTMGDLFARDTGNGEVIATIWHLVASERLHCDLTAVITPDTPVVIAQ